MLEKLGEILERTTDRIANAIFLDKKLVDSIVKDLQRALIEADINVLLVKEISDKVKKAALNERIKSIEKKEHIIKLLYDELTKILGEGKKLEPKEKQEKILLIGLYGSGKTTTAAKLGNYYAKRGKKVALVGLDVHRPAAKEQLKQLAEKNKLAFFTDQKETNAIKIWKKLEKKLKKFQLIIIDTAGRHSLDEELTKEIKELKKTINPSHTILVIPADIGQAAKKQAGEFQKIAKIDGIIITRMDSSAKGGGALTACAETNAPIYFITTGEKIGDIEEFEPSRFLSRIMGMGDLQTLIEKIKSATEGFQEKTNQKLLEGKISLKEVVEQAKSLKHLGGLGKIKSLIPGMGKAKISEDALETQEEKIEKWEHIIKSMTPEEIENPDLFEDKKTGNSRINRVARGAGVKNNEVRALLKQYKILKEMIKGGLGNIESPEMLSQKQIMKLVKKFGKRKFKIW